MNVTKNNTNKHYKPGGPCIWPSICIIVRPISIGGGGGTGPVGSMGVLAKLP